MTGAGFGLLTFHAEGGMHLERVTLDRPCPILPPRLPPAVPPAVPTPELPPPTLPAVLAPLHPPSGHPDDSRRDSGSQLAAATAATQAISILTSGEGNVHGAPSTGGSVAIRVVVRLAGAACLFLASFGFGYALLVHLRGGWGMSIWYQATEMSVDSAVDMATDAPLDGSHGVAEVGPRRTKQYRELESYHDI